MLLLLSAAGVMGAVPGAAPEPAPGAPVGLPAIHHPLPLAAPVSNIFVPGAPPPGPSRRPPAPTARPSFAAASMTNLAGRAAVKPVAPGVFEIGTLRLNKLEGSLSFPAVGNMERGAVEFLLVTSFGRTHESVLRSDVEPYQLHIGMLLLGARGTTNAFGDLPPDTGPTETPYAKPLSGDPVDIEVSWEQDGRTLRRRAEELVVDLGRGEAMSRGEWTYTGSFVHAGVYRAQIDGSIIAVIREPAALVNNPREGADRDEIWAVNTNTVPALDTPVQVTFRLRRPASPGR